AFADSIYVTTQNTMQRQFGNILHPDPKSMRSALVLWRSALVAITRHARQRSSNATLAASPGGLSGLSENLAGPIRAAGASRHAIAFRRCAAHFVGSECHVTR